MERCVVGGGAGSCRRLTACCTHPNHVGGAGENKRNYDTLDGKKSGLGDLEPLAYLGYWLGQCDRFLDAKAHKALNSSTAQVQA